MKLRKSLLIHYETSLLLWGSLRTQEKKQPKSCTSLRNQGNFVIIYLQTPLYWQSEEGMHPEIDHLVPSESRYPNVETSTQFCMCTNTTWEHIQLPTVASLT